MRRRANDSRLGRGEAHRAPMLLVQDREPRFHRSQHQVVVLTGKQDFGVIAGLGSSPWEDAAVDGLLKLPWLELVYPPISSSSLDA